MGKHNCCICGKALGIFSDKTVLKDGAVCHKCLKRGGIHSLPSGDKLQTEYVVNMINSRADAVNNFRTTKRYGRIEVDMNNRAFKVDNDIYLFSNLVSYAYHEDPDNSRLALHNGKSGGAAIGGVIGGLGGGLVGSALGAAVGGKVGSLFSSTCNYMYISITLKETLASDVRLDFIADKTRISSSTYTEAVKRAKSCLEGLQVISEINAADKPREVQKSEKKVYVQNKHLTAAELAEELVIYNNLLRDGVITQEEFDEKKKKLLAMM